MGERRPDEEGIETYYNRLSTHIWWANADLMKKGLRLIISSHPFRKKRANADLMKKGLRLHRTPV